MKLRNKYSGLMWTAYKYQFEKILSRMTIEATVYLSKGNYTQSTRIII